MKHLRRSFLTAAACGAAAALERLRRSFRKLHCCFLHCRFHRCIRSSRPCYPAVVWCGIRSPISLAAMADGYMWGKPDATIEMASGSRTYDCSGYQPRVAPI